MSRETERQRDFWNREFRSFDSIYSRKKGRLGVLLDSIFRWEMRARFEYTMIESSPMEGRSFLDVGCGTGRYSLAFAEGGARRVVGLDISEQMISESRKGAELRGLQNTCDFVLGDPMGFETAERFDISIAIGLFDYIREPLPLIRKIREITTDKSVFTFPRLFTWRAPARKARLALKKCDVFFYSRGRLEALMSEAGYRNFRIRKVGHLYFVTAEC